MNYDESNNESSLNWSPDSSTSSFKVQINDYDTYQTWPTQIDQLYSVVSQVPILRIYGSLSIDNNEINNNLSPKKKKQKNEIKEKSVFNVVIHVHNFYPYFYVDCNETDYQKLQTESFMNKVIDYLENVLKESFNKRKTRKGQEDQEWHDDSETKRKYVANVSICKGVSIYGFQLGYRLFYKISLLSPLYKSRLTNMFHERKISLDDIEKPVEKKPLTYIYEAHIPYLLQFLTDFNLFGCGWININNDYVFESGIRGMYFRSPIYTELHKSFFESYKLNILSKYLLRYLRKDNVLSGSYARIGKSIIELDITTSSILNRSWVKPREIHEDFSERFEFDKYLNDLKISNVPKHGYKHDSEGNPKIYLASLKQIYNDLRFQIKLRNSDYKLNNDVLLTSERLVYFGTGSSKWSNQSELNELLDYVVQINGKTDLDLNTYGDYNFIQDLNFNKFETSYGLVDYEKSLQFHTGKIQTLNWDEFEQLLTENMTNDELMTETNIEGEDEEKETGYLYIEEQLDQNLDPREELDLDEDIVSDKEAVPDIENKAGQDIGSNSDEGPEKLENVQAASLANPSKSIDSIELSETDYPTLDENLVKSATQNEDFLGTFSFTPTVQQQLRNLNVNENTYEISVPDQLKMSSVDAFQSSGTLQINYTDPFYSDPKDLTKPFIFANQKFVIPLKNETTIPKLFSERIQLKSEELTGSYSTWQYCLDPPSNDEVIQYLKSEESRVLKKQLKYKSQIEPGKTQAFKYSYNSEKVPRKPDEFNFLPSFHVEIHANPPNSELVADPLRDSISLIFYSFDDSNEMFEGLKSGVLMFGEFEASLIKSLSRALQCHIEVFADEIEMVSKLVQLVEIFDPDILSGYEINSMSWGYIIERFREVFDINIMSDLSRGTFKSNGKFGDRWGYTHTSNIEICGRHMINVWRVLRSEMSLTSYSLENVTYHLLHRTLPKFDNFKLTQWLKTKKFKDLYIVMSYYMKRIELILKIIDVQELITRNVEHSRLIGIDFNSNFYRGSQYKVESILARIAKTESLLLNSPSKTQVHEMRPFESIPLILEPKANFYKSPLVVLDFQSLYPSIMIAYNYCYSTLLCKLHNYKKNKNDIGYLKSLKLNPGLIDLLRKDDAVNISPNGFMFVKSHLRKSILAKMLEEILNIRIKLKNVMKSFKNDAELSKLYNARQMALKLIANVTYGYTSATYSGRMPCSDIADAIVSTGREILTKSIEMIESEKYGAKVVYGDTDSLFVYFPGKSKLEAFKFGKEIAKKVTEFFPDPVNLKFEKVYHPCILLAKKRYVGYSYEYESQEVPKFDAKGIETVRRDGIPAQQKITEKCLRILFETKNLSLVKDYTLKQFYKILFNKISIQDFCFAKEVKYGNYKDERYLPPGALLASERVKDDPRSEPQYRERIPYIVYRDSSKQRIKDRVLSPEDLIKTYTSENPLTLDYEYYITRVLIPPLARFLNLIGADIKSWYKEMPKYQRIRSAYSDSCLICGNRLDNESHVCSKCSTNEQSLENDVELSFKECQKKYLKLQNVCRSCNLTGYDCVDDCVNRDCSIYYNKVKNANESRQIREKRENIIQW